MGQSRAGKSSQASIPLPVFPRLRLRAEQNKKATFPPIGQVWTERRDLPADPTLPRTSRSIPRILTPQGEPSEELEILLSPRLPSGQKEGAVGVYALHFQLFQN